jgi:hypothetical protein
MQRNHHQQGFAAAAAPNNRQLLQQHHQPQQLWFAGAPASKLLVAFTVLFYVLVHTKRMKNGVFFDSSIAQQRSSYDRQPHRYWTSKLTFGTAREVVVGTGLLAVLSRRYEREMGTRRYAAFLLFVCAATVALEWFLVTARAFPYGGKGGGGIVRYAGPYHLVAALFALYHRFAPRLHPRFFGAAGIHFSEKSLYYAWFLYLCYSGGAADGGGGGWKNTAAPAALGIAACCLYLSVPPDVLDVPEPVLRLLSPLTERLSEPQPPMLSAAPAAMTGGGGGGGRRGVGGRGAAGAGRHHPAHAVFGQRQPAAAAVPPPPPPQQPADPAAVEQLANMGFDRRQVEQALQQTNNDVERAADRLLMMQAAT